MRDVLTPIRHPDTFAEDASQFSESMAVTATVVFPGTGTESAILVTMTAGDEMVFTGTAGAPATCIHVSVETADVPAAVVPATTETFSAVRTAGFTIVSSGALARALLLLCWAWPPSLSEWCHGVRCYRESVRVQVYV